VFHEDHDEMVIVKDIDFFRFASTTSCHFSLATPFLVYFRLTTLDAYRIHTQPPSNWSLQDR
jgi:hypothetical protein